MERRATVIVTLSLLAVGLAPAAAAASTPTAASPDGWQATGRELVDHVTNDAPHTAASHLIALAGPSVEPADVSAREAPGEVPAEIEAPLTDLLGAMDTARNLRDEALADLTAQQVDTILDRANQVHDRSDPKGAQMALDPEIERLVDRVHEPALRQAGLTLLASATNALHHLETIGVTQRAAATCPGVSGDVVYESPACQIVVGDDGQNTYADPAQPRLIVDLGGDDTYRTSAGGASTSEAVEAVIDVEGDDTYDRSLERTGTGQTLFVQAQGSGNGGVGLLLDGAGNDDYTAAVTTSAAEPGPVARSAQIDAQGASVLGAGVLADLGGVDTYTASVTTRGSNATLNAQGAGVLAGFGLLFDDGQPGIGSDVYTATTTSDLHETRPDAFTRTFTKGAAETTAQGGGVLGLGVLADASGDDTYDATSDGAEALTVAQGAGNGGAGQFVDALGDDTLAARALGTAHLVQHASADSACFDLSVKVESSDVFTMAQGTGNVGQGLLVDGGESDTRTVQALSDVEAIATAKTDAKCVANKAQATATGGDAHAQGQGAGIAGSGTLVDLGLAGDENRLTSSTNAFAKAIATSTGDNTESAVAESGDAQTLGQGTGNLGVGLVTDTGGSDTYASEVTTDAKQATSAGTEPGITGQLVQQIQGSGSQGIGVLADTGGSDTYSSDPTGSTNGANSQPWTGGTVGLGLDV